MTRPSPRTTDARSSQQISGAPAADLALFPTMNDLDEHTRRQIVSLLGLRLADAIDLRTQCKHAHWNVKGPHFMQLHLLFDQVNDAVEGYVDTIAERIVQLGGVAEGTVRLVATRSTLTEYPPALSTGHEHVSAFSDALAQFGRAVRAGIKETDDLGDAVTADILTEVSRAIDKWLWLVAAHQQSRSR